MTRSPIANLTMALLSLGLLAWSWTFFRTRTSQVVSVDAVVNATVIDLKAPEEGTITDIKVQTGSAITNGENLVFLRNDRLNQLPLQELESRINQFRSDLQRAQGRLDRLTGLLSKASVDDIQQETLEISEVSDKIRQIDAQIEAAQSRVNLAQIQLDRVKPLVNEGVMPRNNLDLIQAELTQRQQEVRSLEAQRSEMQTRETAAQSGLSLSKTRSNYDPRIRVQELELQISEVRAEIEGLNQRIRDGEKEITQSKADLEKRQQVLMKAPMSGVLWKLNAQAGKFVQRGESIAQIANCQDRWVDALVDEGAVKSLGIGMPAKIQLTGTANNIELTGKIQNIRSGVGRLSAGEEVATPIPPNLPRYSQVRVSLEVSPQSQDVNPTAGNLCYIGYTGRVSFTLPQS